MTELTRQTKGDKALGKKYIVYLSETKPDRKSEMQSQKEEEERKGRKTFDLIHLILQL